MIGSRDRSSPAHRRRLSQDVVVCEAQVPFVHGGAEVHVRELVRELRARGYDAELVSVPFKWYPKEEILPHAAAWRLLDLSESNGRPIDLVIATKFPTYFVRHPNKVAWLIHQYRAAYELCGTPYSDFGHNEGGRRAARHAHPARHRDARRVPAGLRQRAEHRQPRALKYNGLDGRGAVPSAAAGRAARGGGPATATTCCRSGGIESVKRVDLLVSAMARVDKPIRLVVAGDGTQRANVERVAAEAGRRRPGRVPGRGRGRAAARALPRRARRAVSALRRGLRLRHARGVPRAEAGRSPRPTPAARTSSSIDGVNGFVRAPEPEAFAEAINALARDRTRAASHGRRRATTGRGPSPGTASSRSWCRDDVRSSSSRSRA